MYSRMLSVVSCTVSVLRRLSANIKAPVSTVSRSSVAECSFSLVGSSPHAASARGCSKLFTVSTIAWGSSTNTGGHMEVANANVFITSVNDTNVRMNANSFTVQIVTPQPLRAAVYGMQEPECNGFSFTVLINHDKNCQRCKWGHSHADITQAKTQNLSNKKFIFKVIFTL